MATGTDSTQGAKDVCETLTTHLNHVKGLPRHVRNELLNGGVRNLADAIDRLLDGRIDGNISVYVRGTLRENRIDLAQFSVHKFLSLRAALALQTATIERMTREHDEEIARLKRAHAEEIVAKDARIVVLGNERDGARANFQKSVDDHKAKDAEYGKRVVEFGETLTFMGASLNQAHRCIRRLSYQLHWAHIAQISFTTEDVTEDKYHRWHDVETAQGRSPTEYRTEVLCKVQIPGIATFTTKTWVGIPVSEMSRLMLGDDDNGSHVVEDVRVKFQNQAPISASLVLGMRRRESSGPKLLEGTVFHQGMTMAVIDETVAGVERQKRPEGRIIAVAYHVFVRPDQPTANDGATGYRAADDASVSVSPAAPVQAPARSNGASAPDAVAGLA